MILRKSLTTKPKMAAHRHHLTLEELEAIGAMDDESVAIPEVTDERVRYWDKPAGPGGKWGSARRDPGDPNSLPRASTRIWYPFQDLPRPSRIASQFRKSELHLLLTVGNLLVLAKKELDARQLKKGRTERLDNLGLTKKEIREVLRPGDDIVHLPLSRYNLNEYLTQKYLSHKEKVLWLTPYAHLLDAEDFIRYYETLDFEFLQGQLSRPDFDWEGARNRAEYMHYEALYSVAGQGRRLTETASIVQQNFRSYVEQRGTLKAEVLEMGVLHTPRLPTQVVTEAMETAPEMDKALYEYMLSYAEKCEAFIRSVVPSPDFYEAVTRFYYFGHLMFPPSDPPGKPDLYPLASAFEGMRGYFHLGSFVGESGLGEGSVFTPEAIKLYKKFLKEHKKLIKDFDQVYFPTGEWAYDVLKAYGEYAIPAEEKALTSVPGVRNAVAFTDHWTSLREEIRAELEALA